MAHDRYTTPRDTTLVSRASYQNASWKEIAKLLGKSTETVRKTFAPSKVANRLGQLLRHRRTGERLTDGPGPPGQTPAELATISATSSSLSLNRLAPELSAMARRSRMPQRTLAERVGCSPSFLSRVLNGDRLPSWSLTERLGQALGADLNELRAVWECEKLRDKSSRPTLLPAEAGASEAMHVLRTAMEILHIRSGGTRLDTQVLPTRRRLIETRYAAFRGATTVPHWGDVKFLANALGGDTEQIRKLWQQAESQAREAVNASRIPSSATEPSALRRQSQRDQVRIADVSEVLYFHETREKDRRVQRETQRKAVQS
ncbi:helix-turn-helix domain-containing protein [Streptacidiphilus fuscans]|uniref:Helix-turn-helix domain-containing protein n=1 Tax=Streptacidiphilus fuscans TaxID=2789292 RepID=A0A931BEC2_9ACTN|nr:helix-turn-helix transcriptional regulator [Streptacidiphilus fuscans]MBF9071895.1 helix-turn-helix domain-containing protein [Streptacidiphilus fuscans]